jgi:hypothetical protein
MMSVDEIRYWLPELRRRGWGRHNLRRTLAMKADCLNQKASGRQWIYKCEQRRWSRQLERIIAGELVPVRGVPGHVKDKAVLAPHPQPLVPSTQFAYDLKRGRLHLVARNFPTRLRLP